MKGASHTTATSLDYGLFQQQIKSPAMWLSPLRPLTACQYCYRHILAFDCSISSNQFQVHIYIVHPPTCRPSFPSPPLYIHPHHYLLHIIVIPSNDMSVPLLHSFLHFIGYFYYLTFVIPCVFVYRCICACV